MAGVKGRSGGARPNSGGKRPGAGRPKKPAEPAQPGSEVAELPKTDDPVAFLTTLMNDCKADLKLRAEAAKALLPFTHAKKGASGALGKKEQAAGAAKSASGGRFAAAAPPKLAAVGGRKV